MKINRRSLFKLGFAGVVTSMFSGVLASVFGAKSGMRQVLKITENGKFEFTSIMALYKGDFFLIYEPDGTVFKADLVAASDPYFNEDGIATINVLDEFDTGAYKLVEMPDGPFIPGTVPKGRKLYKTLKLDYEFYGNSHAIALEN